MHYYPRLRDLREDKDLTQEQLVKILKMHKTTYTNYEQGKREPPFELIVRLAKLYNVSIDYIAGLTDNPNKWQKALDGFPQGLFYIQIVAYMQ